MDLKKNDMKGNLNVEINLNLIKKAKIKATILGIDLKEYIQRLININTENINLDEYKDKE